MRDGADSADTPAGWDVRAASAMASVQTTSPKPHLRRRARLAVRALAWMLIALGMLALLDVGVTLLWQEPFSALYARIQQDDLSGNLRQIERALPTPPQQRALALLHAERARVAYLAGELQRHARAGHAIGRIRIPRLGIDFVVVKGTGSEELKKGPGLYPQTPAPTVQGTTAIAGHRTTYLAPFRHIDALRIGDSIVLRMPYGRFTYAVTHLRVVLPTDIDVIRPVGYPQLVLSACTPLFSASHRLIVFARLRSIQPLGAARLGATSVPEVRYPSIARPPGRAPSPPNGLPQVLKPLQQLPLSLIA